MGHIAQETQMFIFQNLPIQTVLHGPLAWASSEWLREMQTLRPLPRPPESESAFSQDPQVSLQQSEIQDSPP